MSHHARKKYALALYHKLDSMTFTCVTPVFDENNSEWDNGVEALQLHDDSDYHVVIQDDAIIGNNFYVNLEAALKSLPQKSLLSLYLGQGRPSKYHVISAFNKAINSNSSFISHTKLLWGVCIAIPTKDIELILEHAKRYSKLQYDNRIGTYYRDIRKPIYYTTISIVDHDDSLPSLTGHHTNLKRVAHKYSDELLVFNSKIVEMAV